MCGIAGIVKWSGGVPDACVLQSMTDRLRHRGPDGEGHYVNENVALGHRRLSIIDVDSGKQPMCNEDSTVWVTFNGEIYNFGELRRQLVSSGHSFRTQSDTEVIVHGYEQWGEGVVQRLRGMFAFAAYNSVTGELLLARDHFGVKPLVYYEGSDCFVFASELKAILADPDIESELDMNAVAQYFEYGYVPAPKTILSGFSKLLPGHLVTLQTRNRGPARPRRYWRLEFGTADCVPSDQDAVETVRELLGESVKSQMVSDVPLGAMLSGGIDSSAVVALMARESRERVKTFSIGFDDERFSETNYARLVAAANNSEHHEKVVTADIHSLLPRLVSHFDEPFADASAVPTYYLCEMARQHVTVSLSGDGGDELFAGYDRYSQCMDLGMLDFIPEHLRKLVLGPVSRLYHRGPGSGFIRGAQLGRDERFVQDVRGQYGALSVYDVLDKSLHAELAGHVGYDTLYRAFNPGTSDTLDRYLEVDTATYLPNDILTKVDITSMMNSLEVRVPFLDHKLAEYVAKLPSHMKLNRGIGKFVLKRAMEGLLSKEVLYRRKMGFGVPMRKWVVTQLRDTVHGYLLDSSRTSGLLDSKLLAAMVKDNEANLYASRYGGRLWWVLFFEMWYQDVFCGRAR